MPPPSADSAAELLARARDGEDGAFATLVERHRAAALARLRGKLSDPHDRADAWQETILGAWRALAELRDPARFGAWLARIAAHKADGWHRRRYAQARLLDLLGEGDAPASSAGLPASAADESAAAARAALARAFRRLSREHRGVILGHYHDGQSYEQLSASLQITPGLVRSRLQKARTRLKTEIEKTMTTSASAETLRLGPDDIAALLALAGVSYRGPDPRPALRGVLLDAPRGRATATDGRHFATHRVPALSALGEPVLVRGWESAARGRFSDGATLALGLAEAILTDSSGEPFALPIVDASFPDHAHLVKIAAPGGLVVSAQALTATLAELTPYLAERHAPPAGWSYTPLVRLEWRDDALLVSTHERLGLAPVATAGTDGKSTPASANVSAAAAARAPADIAPSGPPRWRHELALPARVAADFAPTSALVNSDLLVGALRVLAAGRPRELRLAYEPATPILRVEQVDAPENFALVMPVKSDAT